jgi:hypothetical protein
LIVNAAGTTTFGDGVGNDFVGSGNAILAGSGALTYLVTDAGTVAPANGPGTTVVNATSVTTIPTGDQLYNDAVVIGSNDMSTTTTFNGNDITFISTLDGTTAGAEALVVNTTSGVGEMDVTVGVDGILGTLDDGLVAGDDTGTTTFGRTGFIDGTDDNVGGVTPVASITTNADGLTVINSAVVTSTGFQTYNDNVLVLISGMLLPSGDPNTTTTLNSTIAGDITVGSMLTQFLMGVDNVYDELVANAAGGNVNLISAISNLYKVNGSAAFSFIGGNPDNTGINLYLSQPIAPLVYLYTAPPAQYRGGLRLIDVGTLLWRDVQGLINYKNVDRPLVDLDMSSLISGSSSERTGAMEGDSIMSSFDLLEIVEEEREENE